MPTLEITTNVGCPLACRYCPQDKISKAYKGPKLMTLNAYAGMLEKVPDYVRIDFSGMAEPWVNPECTELLRHTLKMGFTVAIYTTLYGMKDAGAAMGLLREKASQIEIMVVHLPDSSGNMRGFEMSKDYNRAMKEFILLREENCLRDIRVMAMGGVSGLLKRYGFAVRHEDWSGNNRAGSLDRNEIGNQPVTAVWDDGPVTCSFTPFYDQNVLLPNGDVVLCCMDYGLKHIIGNLTRDDYFDMFTSDAMNEIRRENMQCSNRTICKSCDRATRYKQPEDRKQYWEVTSAQAAA